MPPRHTPPRESPSKRPMSAFQVLAEPIRIFLIETLCVGEQTSGDLAELAYFQFGVSWSAVSRHLVVLRRSGFVRVIYEETKHWYALEDHWLELVTDEVDALRRLWDDLSADRALGFSGAVPSFAAWPPPRAPDRRGNRGRTTRNRATRDPGGDRSWFVDEVDGGAGLDRG